MCTLTSERSGTTDCRDQWAEQRHVTSCLSSTPSSTGYCQRRHRSVNNVKPVAFELKIWVVNMLSVRWEHGACAVALMLRADIRQFSIVRRLVNEDICAVPLMLRADILSTTLTSGTFTAIENSLMSARNIRATAHMSSFTSRRTIENCLMSARNIRATAHAPRSQRTLNMYGQMCMDRCVDAS